MAFNNANKFLSVFSTLLLIGGSTGFCSNELFNNSEYVKNNSNNIMNKGNGDVIQKIKQNKMALNQEIYETISKINNEIKQCALEQYEGTWNDADYSEHNMFAYRMFENIRKHILYISYVIENSITKLRNIQPKNSQDNEIISKEIDSISNKQKNFLKLQDSITALHNIIKDKDIACWNDLKIFYNNMKSMNSEEQVEKGKKLIDRLVEINNMLSKYQYNIKKYGNNNYIDESDIASLFNSTGLIDGATIDIKKMIQASNIESIIDSNLDAIRTLNEKLHLEYYGLDKQYETSHSLGAFLNLLQN